MKTSAEKCSDKYMLWGKGVWRTLVTVKIYERYPWGSSLLKLQVMQLSKHLTPFTSIFDYNYQSQLATFMNTYCSEQLVLHNSSDSDF